ncbi:hypothetical protein [Actinosynnema sp. NPDC023587]|uniref:hypothetical protein n=1 Tax=Actinosynnema sp. NPDC023587 TaxID=3154695 RepID=UPI0033C776E6
MATVIVTVCLAFVGYLVTYLNGLRLAQRQARLTFSAKYARPDGRDPFRHDTPPDDRELAEWRIRAATVFIPTIQAMRDVVVTKADLLIDEEMPPASATYPASNPVERETDRPIGHKIRMRHGGAHPAPAPARQPGPNTDSNTDEQVRTPTGRSGRDTVAPAVRRFHDSGSRSRVDGV